MTRTGLAFAGLFVLAAGCSQGGMSPAGMMQPAGPAVVVSPADAATGVRLDAAVELTFAAPADAAVVESDFQLFSEPGMADSLCLHEGMMPHGGMQEAMMDPDRMQHMMEFHAISGGLTWSDGGRRCTFRPDSMMAPRTRHMIHLGPAAMDMMEGRMGGMTMDGHGSGEMARHMMFHFTTMDTTGGHDGHHRQPR